ncbi:MAG: hypothetical protein QXT26_06565 [Thermoproteota archaeon]
MQEKASKKPSLRKVLAKYSRRERNRARDFIHKLTTFLSREYKGYVHGFESLEKRMFNSSRKHNREVAKSDWKTMRSFMAYKSKTMTLNPKNSSKLFKELMRAWGGFTLTGEEVDEELNELKRAPRLVNPKSYISLPKST